MISTYCSRRLFATDFAERIGVFRINIVVLLQGK
jgi:hypothetical protein